MNTFYIGCENIETVQEFSGLISICSIDELKEIYGYILRHSHKYYLESEESYKVRYKKLESFLDIIRDAINARSEAIAIKATNKKGRTKQSFRESMVDDPEGKKLAVLHKVMTNRIGRGAALVMICAQYLGWITKVNSTQVKDEFGDIGNVSGYNSYVGAPSKYKENEIGDMKALLMKELSSI